MTKNVMKAKTASMKSSCASESCHVICTFKATDLTWIYPFPWPLLYDLHSCRVSSKATLLCSCQRHCRAHSAIPSLALSLEDPANSAVTSQCRKWWAQKWSNRFYFCPASLLACIYPAGRLTASPNQTSKEAACEIINSNSTNCMKVLYHAHFCSLEGYFPFLSISLSNYQNCNPI